MAIDKIISFGDSFVFGSDLRDCDNETQHSLSTWPALAAKELNLEYGCYAMGGVGNQYIADKIISNPYDHYLAVINWTWIDRFDFVTADDEPETLRPSSDNELGRIYYEKLHSEIDDKFRNLCYIQTAHEYLRKKKIPFVSTIMDPLLLDQEHNVNQGILNLQQEINSDLSWFPDNSTFLNWSRINAFPESQGWHPLEEAHEEAAKYWQPIYEKAINTHIT